MKAGLMGDEVFLLILGFEGDSEPLAFFHEESGSSKEVGMVESSR